MGMWVVRGKGGRGRGGEDVSLLFGDGTVRAMLRRGRGGGGGGALQGLMGEGRWRAHGRKRVSRRIRGDWSRYAVFPYP